MGRRCGRRRGLPGNGIVARARLRQSRIDEAVFAPVSTAH
jgi:hypothetical protein